MNFSLSLNSEKYLLEEIRFDVAVVLNKLRRKTSQNDDDMNDLVPDFPVASSDIPRVSHSNHKKEQQPKEETKSTTQAQAPQPTPEPPRPEHMASFLISSMLDPRGILASQQTLGPGLLHSSSLRLQSSNFSELARSELVPVPTTPPPSGIFPVLTQLSLFDSFQNETWHNPEYLLLGTNPHH